MRILVDMNLSPGWVEFLGSHHISAIHWSKVGSASAADIEIMNYAASADYHVLTNDLDFGSILAITHGKKPSVIQIRSDNLNPDIIGSAVVSALLSSANLLDEGALLTIDPKRLRLRFLPFEG